MRAHLIDGKHEFAKSVYWQEPQWRWLPTKGVQVRYMPKVVTLKRLYSMLKTTKQVWYDRTTQLTASYWTSIAAPELKLGTVFCTQQEHYYTRATVAVVETPWIKILIGMHITWMSRYDWGTACNESKVLGASMLGGIFDDIFRAQFSLLRSLVYTELVGNGSPSILVEDLWILLSGHMISKLVRLSSSL